MAERPGSSVSFGSNPMNSQTNLQPEKVVPRNTKKKNPVLRFFGAIWATKDTKADTENRDIIVKTTIKELIIYIIFLVVITIVTFGMTNTINYYFTNVLINLFTTQWTDPIATENAPMNWVSIGFQADAVLVLQYTTIRAMYWDTWYNNDNASNMIYYENKLLGLPRIRQVRVKNGSCKIQKQFAADINTCYDSYSYSSEDQSPFGYYTTDPTDTAWKYTSASKLQAPLVSGLISTYGAGGYYKDLGLDYTTSQKIVMNLLNNYWLDRGTRAVFLDFTVYNANINMFCAIRLILECPAAGGCMPSYSFRTVKLIRYVTPFDYAILGLEILFVIFLVYYTIEEAFEIKIHKLKYFKEVWNILDVCILILGYICVAFNIYRTISVGNILDGLLANPNQYASFETLVIGQLNFNYTIAILTFLCWVKFFKYVSFNKTMNQLSETLGRCAKDVVGFSIMFFIVFFAYAQLGYLLFGSMLFDYSTITNAIFALFRTVLGDFDFIGLQTASPVLGPIYFISYIFFVFFVLINMFLAIINDTYSGVKSDLTTDGLDAHFTAFFKRGYDSLMTKLHIKKKKLVDIQHALESADANNDKELTFDEWKHALKKRGFADTEIDAYFSQYDLDGNQTLSIEEQKKMHADLTKQCRSVDTDMDTIKENKKFELTTEENEDEKKSRFAHLVSPSEFKVMNQRVDTMEFSIGTIVNRIDIVLSKLESLEKTKLERREAMARILDRLNEANNCPDPIRRAQLQQMVREDLEKWEIDTTVSLAAVSRVSSAQGNIREDSTLGSRQPTNLSGSREGSTLGARQPTSLQRDVTTTNRVPSAGFRQQ